MRAIVNVYVRSKIDTTYDAYEGQCVVDLPVPCDNLPKEDHFLMRELERMAMGEFRTLVSSNGWIVLYKDPFDIEEEAVLVNLTGYEAIDVEVRELLSEKDYKKAHLKRFEYALRNSKDIAEYDREEDYAKEM